ncbi:AraC family transcriptional regulator [Nibrella saemangeumensis]|uniref:AraC family transcriptional regulator n=1 Tax=Nibrella saemangeumensis TaxID=1084526 RepID=A0ABP8MJC6_9BACT
MTNIYDFLKFQPNVYRQFVCKDLLIAYYDCTQASKQEEFFSHFSYITFVVNGERCVHRRGKSWLLRPNACLFFKKGALMQDMYFSDNFRSLNLYLPDSYLQQQFKEYLKSRKTRNLINQPSEQVFELAVNQTTEGFIQALLALFEQQPAPTDDIIEQRARELLFSFLLDQDNKPLTTYLNSLINRRQTSLYEVMEANYMFNLSLEQFSRIANRSLATFKREFTRLFHTTPARWLMQKRLTYAKTLLETTELPVNDVAYESGFENTSHFSRVFKERFGLSPLFYRKQHHTVLIPEPQPALAIY